MRIGHFTPTYTPICDGQVAQLLREADAINNQLKYDYRWWSLKASDISMVRNMALAQAIGMECDFLCMQDSDIWSDHPQGVIARMVKTAIDTDAAMVAAICGLRTNPVKANVEPYNPGKVYEAKRVGTGLVVIDCKKAADIKGMAFGKVYADDGCSIKTSEDVWFCERLIEAGHKVFVDGLVPTTHVNIDVSTLDYPGAATESGKSPTSNPAEIGAH